MFAGTSFLLEHADGTLMVGANHILKGVNLDLESKGIEVGLRSKRKNLAIPFLKRVPIENQGDATYSSPPETSRAQGDLAVLFVKDLNKGAKPMKLGTVDVKKGEPVWIAELQGPMSAPTGVDLVPGVVDYHSSKVLTVKMHRKTSVGETSGAPILNAQGEVVGVNVGVSYSDAGDFRIAVPGASVRALKNLQTPSGVPRTPR